MRQTLFTDKKRGKIIFGTEVEWTAFRETATFKMFTGFPIVETCATARRNNFDSFLFWNLVL